MDDFFQGHLAGCPGKSPSAGPFAAVRTTIRLAGRTPRTRTLQSDPTATVAVPARGIDGFLGTRASFGMDVVLVGLIALLPVLAWSIALVRRGNYAAHKRLQLVIAGGASRGDRGLRDRRPARERLEAAPPGGRRGVRAEPWWPAGVLAALGIHLVFAVSTFVLWVWVIWEALHRFPSPPAPGTHGPRHRVHGAAGRRRPRAHRRHRLGLLLAGLRRLIEPRPADRGVRHDQRQSATPPK